MSPDQVKSARLALGLTQSRLGRALRLAPGNADNTVRKWESGARRISGPASLAIEMLLEMTPEQRKRWGAAPYRNMGEQDDI